MAVADRGMPSTSHSAVSETQPSATVGCSKAQLGSETVLPSAVAGVASFVAAAVVVVGRRMNVAMVASASLVALETPVAATRRPRSPSVAAVVTVR